MTADSYVFGRSAHELHHLARRGVLVEPETEELIFGRELLAAQAT